MVAAFRVRLSINVDFNDILEQFIDYRREARQRRVVQECPHVYPVNVNGFRARPGFKSAYMLDDDGRFICSMCGLTGVVTKETVASIEASWSTKTWKFWGERMNRRLKAQGVKVV